MAITNASGVGEPGNLPGDPGSSYNRIDGPPFLYKKFGNGWVAADVLDDDGMLSYGCIPMGSSSASVCAGNDSRLSDARTPTAHAHVIADITDYEEGGGPHNTTHQNGGADEINVGGLSGVLAEPQTPIAHSHDLSAVWPVGSVFISVVSTNPATLLGFGTWAAFAAGRVLVGIDAGQAEFDTLEETGGAKTHTLTSGEIPAHTHVQDPHTHTQNAHSHVVTSQTATSGSATSYEHGTLDTSSAEAEATETTATATAVNQNATATNQNTGGGGAHNNLAPYVVVSMWRRTA